MDTHQERFCYACDSNESEKYKTTSGELRNNWLVNRGTPFVLCRACNNYYIRRPPKVRIHSYIESIKDRRCSECDLSDPNPNGKEKYWMKNKEEIGKWLCTRCYAKKYQHKKNNPRVFLFRKKRVFHSNFPRIGVCNLCRAIVGQIDGQTGKLCKITSLHHEQYDDNNKLKHTIELCNRCHAKITKKGESYTPVFRRCYICEDNNGLCQDNIKKRWLSTNDGTDRFVCNICCKRCKRHKAQRLKLPMLDV